MQKNKKRIAIIGLRAYPAAFVGTSGIEFYVAQVLAELQKKHTFLFDIYVRTSYQQLVRTKRKHPYINSISMRTVSSKILETLFYSFSATIWASISSARIVWFHGIGSALFAFIPWLFGKKVFVTIHGLDWQRQKWNRHEQFLFTLLAKFVLKLPIHFISVSEQVIQDLPRTLYPLTIAKPGFSTVAPKRSALTHLEGYGLGKKQYLLFLGRIVPEKRLEWLLLAHSELKKWLPNLALVIAGGHGNMPEYEQELRRRFDNPDVIWTGYVFGPSKQQLLAQSSCLVLPSQIEGFSISMMEALSLEIPCVVARSFVPSDLRKTGFVHTFSLSDRTTFLMAVVQALANKRTAWSRRQLRQLEKTYSWKQTAAHYNLLFSEA